MSYTAGRREFSSHRIHPAIQRAAFTAGSKKHSYQLKVGALDHTMTAEEVTGIRNNIIQGMQTLGLNLRGL